MPIHVPMSAARPPKVLLVEDDASIRRFVEMALEELPLTLVCAGSLAEAEARLAEPDGFAAVISDLMLPDGSGATLLQALAADPARRRGARLVAFSAGVSAARREQLVAIGVDEVLAKPVALAALEDCVQRALAASAAAATPAPAPARPAADDDVVQRFFGGDAALYAAYRASCRTQFAVDLRDGDAALAGGDLAALRRLAHSLKTVLQTLGEPEAARRAAGLELVAAAADGTPVEPLWAALAADLRGLR